MAGNWYWLVLFACVLFALSVAIVAVLLYAHSKRMLDPHEQLADARTRFAGQRARLEEAFMQAAASSGKPRGLRWKECQFGESIEWVRDKETGQLLALIGVTIAFEAIEGGDMEGVDAVGNLRNATAVFFFDGDWRTAGRAIFNLNPDEALAHFQKGYERVPT